MERDHPESSRDLTDLIAELPVMLDWPQIPLRRFRNFYFPDVFLHSVIAMDRSFQARPDDILICSFPKSGTTWIKALAYAAMNRVQQPLDDRHPLLHRNPHDLVPFMEKFFCRPGYTSKFEALDSPRILGFHSPYSLLTQSVKTSGCRIVYVYRDPKDVLVSQWHFLNKLEFVEEPLPFEKAFDMFCEGVCPFGPVWEHVLEYWQESLRRPDKVLFFKYEEMLEEPTVAVKRLAEFMGCPFSRAEEEEDGVVERMVKVCSFENLKELDVNKHGKMETFSTKNEIFFRKGEKGDWKNYLSPEMEKKMDQITEEKLKGSGLCFL